MTKEIMRKRFIKRFLKEHPLCFDCLDNGYYRLSKYAVNVNGILKAVCAEHLIGQRNL